MKAEERTMAGTTPKTASQIAGEIEPTKTGIDKVLGEMATDEKYQNKDEKPGEEYGEN